MKLFQDQDSKLWLLNARLFQVKDMYPGDKLRQRRELDREIEILRAEGAVECSDAVKEKIISLVLDGLSIPSVII